MASEPAPSPLEKVLLAYLDLAREFRVIAEGARMHRDKMLTWAIGLMGGGLFAVVNLAGGRCSAVGARALIWSASPWAAGVLLAVLGRIANAAYSEGAGAFVAAEAYEIRGALAHGLDADSAQQLFTRLSESATRIEYEKKAKVAKRASRFLYYLTLVALILGMISVFWRIVAR